MPDSVLMGQLHLSKACWELWLSDDQPHSDYNGQWQRALCILTVLQSSQPNPQRNEKNRKMYAIKHIKICAEYPNLPNPLHTTILTNYRSRPPLHSTPSHPNPLHTTILTNHPPRPPPHSTPSHPNPLHTTILTNHPPRPPPHSTPSHPNPLHTTILTNHPPRPPPHSTPSHPNPLRTTILTNHPSRPLLTALPLTQTHYIQPY